MSKIEVDAIEPQSGTTLTIGASGDTIIVPAGTVSLPAITTTGDTNTGIFFPAADTIAFSEGGVEAMRIDSSGNLLIGKTSTTNSVAGSKFGSGGQIVATVANDDIMILNRTGSDGNILRFFKDTSEVGSIGVASSKLHIASVGNSGIRFRDDLNSIIPCNSDGSNSDNDQDLGYSTVRWRRLYLSEGAYLGGTGTANLLDDYEEGDWTPGYVAGSGTPVYSVRAGSYTKVGRQVTVTGAVSGARGSISGDIKINGLPFTCGSVSKFSNSVSLLGANWSTVFSFKGKVNENDTTLSLYKEDTDNTSFVGVNQGDMRTSSASENYVQFTITYFTD